MLFAALSTGSGNIRGAASAGAILFHFFVVMAALPFLLISINKEEGIPRWFRNIIVVLSILNAIFMLISNTATSSTSDTPFFVASALLELLPILLLYRKREYILGKEVVVTS
jgi:hypothetical protein